MMDGWGIERYVVDDLNEKYDCEQIRIKELDDDVIYVISMDDFNKHSVERDFDTPQRFVSRKYFKKLDAKTWRTLPTDSDS